LVALPQEAYADIAVSYQKAVGLNLTSFCDARTSNCPDWSFIYEINTI